MRRSHIIILRSASWITIVTFLFASAWYGLAMRHLFDESRQPDALPMMGGEVVTDFLCKLLNYGVPAAGVGLAGLALDVHRNRGSAWPIWLVGVIILGVAALLVYFGLWYFRESLGIKVLPLSSQVWWMFGF